MQSCITEASSFYRTRYFIAFPCAFLSSHAWCRHALHISALNFSATVCVPARLKPLPTTLCRTCEVVPSATWFAITVMPMQTYADRLARQGCALVHASSSERDGAGENLWAKNWWGWTDDSDKCKEASDSWYAEKSQYRFTRQPWIDNQPNFYQIGHFTQMVWKASTRLGCAEGRGNNCAVVVCRYGPSGNFMGDSHFYENVQAEGSSTSSSSGNTGGNSGGNTNTDTSGNADSDDGNASCQDYLNWCRRWSQQGYCSPRYQYRGYRVNAWCPNSCGMCGTSRRRILKQGFDDMAVTARKLLRRRFSDDDEDQGSNVISGWPLVHDEEEENDDDGFDFGGDAMSRNGQDIPRPHLASNNGRFQD